MDKKQMAQLAKQREQEYNEQLQQVRELELKARYWKAQFDIRHFTLEAEKLQIPYDEYLDAQREKQERAIKEYQEMLDKISKEQEQKDQEMMDVVVSEETLRLNPDMVNEGVKVGDVIQIPKESDLTPEEELQAIVDFEREHPEYKL